MYDRPNTWAVPLTAGSTAIRIAPPWNGERCETEIAGNTPSEASLGI